VTDSDGLTGADFVCLIGNIGKRVATADPGSWRSLVNALNYDGGVNVGNYLRIVGKSIYNNLFNRSGFNHGILTDLNNISDFGFRFLNEPGTNGPGTTSNPGNQIIHG
jgi:hypothetical protein